MDQQEYGIAYENGCARTVNFLVQRGLPLEDAREAAQAAWVRGWERRHQIRDDRKTLAWVNSIALNMYRSGYRKEAGKQEFQDLPVPPRLNLAAIDVQRMLNKCSRRDRNLLQQRYLLGYDIVDIAVEQQCTETAVRVRLVRARRSLRKQFERKPALNQGWHGHREGKHYR